MASYHRKRLQSVKESLQPLEELVSQDGAAKPGDGPSNSHGSKVGTGRAVHAVGDAATSRSAFHTGLPRVSVSRIFACRVAGWQPALPQKQSPRQQSLPPHAHHRVRAYIPHSAQGLPGQPQTTRRQAASKPWPAPPAPLQCRLRVHRHPQQRCQLPGQAAGRGTAGTGLPSPWAAVRKRMRSKSQAPSSMRSPCRSQTWIRLPRRSRPRTSCPRGMLGSPHQRPSKITRPQRHSSQTGSVSQSLAQPLAALHLAPKSRSGS